MLLVALLRDETVLLTTTATTTNTAETTSKSPVPLDSKKRPSEEHFERLSRAVRFFVTLLSGEIVLLTTTATTTNTAETTSKSHVPFDSKKQLPLGALRETRPRRAPSDFA